MRISNYIQYILRSEEELAKAFKIIAKHHILEPDVNAMCNLLASWSLDHVQNLKLMVKRYGSEEEKEPDRIDYSLLTMRTGSLGLLRDLHDLWLMASEVKLCWIILLQAARALRDTRLKLACVQYGKQTKRQIEWLMTKIKESTSQILTVPV
ncbi:MAG: molybdopterin oxidoreductase [Flavisolibacter sp.]